MQLVRARRLIAHCPCEVLEQGPHQEAATPTSTQLLLFLKKWFSYFRKILVYFVPIPQHVIGSNAGKPNSFS